MKTTSNKNKVKSKTSCSISSRQFFTYIHTKLHVLFSSLLKNRFCKHCFRSFRHGSSISLLQSVSSYLVENIQRLRLWHLQMFFFFSFNFLTPTPILLENHLPGLPPIHAEITEREDSRRTERAFECKSSCKCSIDRKGVFKHRSSCDKTKKTH